MEIYCIFTRQLFHREGRGRGNLVFYTQSQCNFSIQRILYRVLQK